MSKCDTCKFHATDDGWAACDRCIHCPGMTDMYKPLTNADHIRAMSDSELAEIIMCPYGIDEDSCNKKSDCLYCLTEWLQQPYESPTGQKG